MTSIGAFTPTYDGNGNVTNDGLHTYTWDVEARPVVTDGVNVTYDALNRMVEQNRSGVYTQIVYSPTGQKLALMNAQTLQKAFIPLPGGATAVYTGSGLDHYRHPDWLGSARLTSSPTRTVLSSVAYAPFGEPYAQFGPADLSFTGQNQDTSGGAYDFPAREYGIRGRWASPDPLGLAAADLTNPQSLNLYAYVRNNPLRYIDLWGLAYCSLPGQTIDEEQINREACIFGGEVWTNDNGPQEVLVTSGGGSDFGPVFPPYEPGHNPTESGGTGGGGGGSGGGGGNSSGGFFSGLKDKFLDFLARNANYLPGVCTAGAFGFGTGGVGNDKGGLQGGVLIDKQIGQPATTQPIGEVGYGPVGVGQTPSETLVFVEPAPKVPVGVVYAANPQNGFINNSGISIGFFAGKAGSGKGLAGGFGGGAYLTFSSAANCLKNF